MNVDVDIIHGSHDKDKDDDDDDDEDEEPSSRAIMKMTKRKVRYEDIEGLVEGLGDDEHKSERQEQTVLPLEGGLAGLISNLSGVKFNQILFGKTVSINFLFMHSFRVQMVQILELSSVSNEVPIFNVHYVQCKIHNFLPINL